MKRRAALAGLLGSACGAGIAQVDVDRGAAPSDVAAPSTPGVPPPRVAASGGVLVWGPSGHWVGHAHGGMLWALPGFGRAAAPTAVAPVPVAGGAWGLASDRRLAHWRRNAGDSWSIASARDFDDPVLALAASADGRIAAAAHGEQLTLLDDQGVVLRRYAGTDLARRRHGHAAALFHLAQRRSFVAVWPGLGELWEISHDRAAEPIYDGLVHDYRLGEGIAAAGYLGVRRAVLGAPMPEFGFTDGRVPWVAGVLDQQVQVVHLDVRRRIALWPQPGAVPRRALLLREGADWVWWLPSADVVHRVETARWQPVGRETLPGAVRALQALGSVVWALTGDAAASALSIRRDGRWEPVELPAGEPQSIAADHAGARMLVLLGRPARLLALDREGLPRAEWALPAGAAPQAARWLPAET